MKIIMVAAMSTDGFITNSVGEVATWTSSEDKQFFANIKTEHNLYVMGSKTYEASPKKPEKGKLRVILTRSPEKYAEEYVPSQLEFHTLTPEEFALRYKDHKTCLLLGGGFVYEEFLIAGLVDEVYLTVEPILLNSGTKLLRGAKSIDDFVVSKYSETRLNKSGTFLRHYRLS